LYWAPRRRTRIQLDELIEKLGILPLEAACDGEILSLASFSEGRDRHGTAVHSPIDAGIAEKDAFFVGPLHSSILWHVIWEANR
jgi:hypothetical protein